MEYIYDGIKFTFDLFTKNIYIKGVRIWQDTDNLIGDSEYYDSFEDWVRDNYYDYINEWLEKIKE